MKLGQIVEQVKDILLEAPQKSEVEINSICCDSRKVVPGSLFVAVKGSNFDGDDFIGEAIKSGAVAIATESSLTFSVPVLKVKNSYQALSWIAEAFYGNPAEGMHLVGVTGTNGKSSTVYILDAIFREAGKKTGMIGTICNRIGQNEEKAVLTTPDALMLQEMFTQMKQNGVDSVSMEVSSHALSQYRTGKIPFKIAVFTNLTQDHLDYHGNMENYFNAKKKIFDEFLHESGKAIINIDDEYGPKLYSSLHKQMAVSVGTAKTADYRIEKIKCDRSSTSYSLISDKEEIQVETFLTGKFNVYNSALAIVAALKSGVEKKSILKSLSNFHGVPGRLELFTSQSGKRVYVDYAHTPDALFKVLESLQGSGERLLCIFGCGGDRDKTKRPLMAQAAEAFADIVWVTDDNPRTEKPDQIRREILEGFAGKKEVREVGDRYEAIKEAIEFMRKDDVLLVAGKGHEDYQIYGTEKTPFCDRKAVREILEKESA